MFSRSRAGLTLKHKVIRCVYVEANCKGTGGEPGEKLFHVSALGQRILHELGSATITIQSSGLEHLSEQTLTLKIAAKPGKTRQCAPHMVCYICNSESAKESVPRARTRQGLVCLPLKNFGSRPVFLTHIQDI